MSKNILLIDDEVFSNDTYRHMLSRKLPGYDFISANSMDDTISKFNDHEIEFILSDYDLNECKTCEIFVQLMAQSSKILEVPILLVTGHYGKHEILQSYPEELKIVGIMDRLTDTASQFDLIKQVLSEDYDHFVEEVRSFRSLNHVIDERLLCKDSQCILLSRKSS